MNVIWVALGGAVGAVARYGVGVGMKRLTGDSAWGTLSVNLIGSFLIGMLWTAVETRLPDHQKLVLMTGFLGAFTTFSAFNLDAWRYVSENKHGTAFIYLALSILGGLALVFAGCKAGTMFQREGLDLQKERVEVTTDE